MLTRSAPVATAECVDTAIAFPVPGIIIELVKKSIIKNQFLFKWFYVIKKLYNVAK